MNTLLCMGDSNTWGYDPHSPFEEPYPLRWTALGMQTVHFTDYAQGSSALERLLAQL